MFKFHSTYSYLPQLTKMEECSLPNKLELLFSKSQFQLALDLASAQSTDAPQIADIHRRFADYLYEKADFEGAMAHFLETIGFTEPSYVIRKVYFCTPPTELHVVGRSYITPSSSLTASESRGSPPTSRRSMTTALPTLHTPPFFSTATPKSKIQPALMRS